MKFEGQVHTNITNKKIKLPKLFLKIIIIELDKILLPCNNNKKDFFLTNTLIDGDWFFIYLEQNNLSLDIELACLFLLLTSCN